MADLPQRTGQQTPYQAIVSLPIDSDEFGAAAAVDLYYTEPRPHISDEEMAEIGLATDIIGALLVANSRNRCG